MLALLHSCFIPLAFSLLVHATVSNLQAPIAAVSGGSITVTWANDGTDSQPLTLALFGAFNGPFAIANDVDPLQDTMTVALPPVPPGSQYTLGLISMSNTANVLATSPAFEIYSPGSTPTGAKVTPSPAVIPTPVLTTATAAATTTAATATMVTTGGAAASSATGKHSFSVISFTETQRVTVTSFGPQPSTSRGDRMQFFPTVWMTALVIWRGLALAYAVV